MNYEILFSKLKALYQKILSLDYSNPRILLMAIAFCILPFIAKYLVLTGLVIGICLAVSVLFIVEKAPVAFKRWIHRNPLYSDLILSTFAVISIGSFLGTGLTLALGFIFLDILLALCLPAMTDEDMINKAQMAHA